MDELSIEHKRTWVKGLMIDCPMGEALDDCPARELRTMPIEKRLIVVDEMTPGQVEEVIVYHKQCLKKREGR
ncbi:MAG: hypothetical protein ISS69_08070 [Phycisphaerae bacterium]|nr:hypothetical protein [Phycisphaerae bacterium]